MAYYLEFDGVDDYVAAPLWTPSGVNWEFEVEFEINAFDRNVVPVSNGTFGNGIYINFNSNTLNLWTAGFVTGISSPSLGVRYTLKSVSSGGNVTHFINENNLGSDNVGQISPTLSLNIGRRVSTGASFVAFELYSCKFTDLDNTSNSRFYDPSASNGTGSILPDTVGSNDGTLVNFPTDNSQWVFYSDATGVTADVAYTVNSPSVSASASATIPATHADVAFYVSTPSVSASVSATLPQPASDIAFTVNAPSVAANASATLPGYSATVSFAVSAPSVSTNASATLPNPSVDIGYTVSAPTINASAGATLPNPVSGIAFSVSVPSVSVSAAATEPNFNANVAFTVDTPTVSISARATLPQPESAVSFNVSPPSVSVVAIVGGIAIIVDEETNINQRVLSNNINAPELSNNING